MLELYHAGLSSCSKRARLCLKEKGLPYVSHYLDLYRFEHHGPDYLKLNPDGIVPTLVHDGTVIRESAVINEYLDEVFPDRPLRPADAPGRARMRVFVKMADEAALPAMRVPIWTRFRLEQLRSMPEDEFERVAERTPIAEHRLRLRALRAGGFSDEAVEESRARMDHVYDRCERALAGGPYLAGEAFTLAEIAILPYLDAFKNFRPELMATHPRVRDWHQRLMARPAVAETYRPSEEAPEVRFGAPRA